MSTEADAVSVVSEKRENGHRCMKRKWNDRVQSDFLEERDFFFSVS